MLHQAACNIVKKPGQMYYLYEKSLGKNMDSKYDPTNFEYYNKKRGDDMEDGQENENLETEDRESELTQAYFSIMSPEDWGCNMPHKFLGGYRLGYDMQFTEEKDIGKDQETWDIIHRVYERTTNVGRFCLENGRNEGNSFRIAELME